jgi:hypothetical protein
MVTIWPKHPKFSVKCVLPICTSSSFSKNYIAKCKLFNCSFIMFYWVTSCIICQISANLLYISLAPCMTVLKLSHIQTSPQDNQALSFNHRQSLVNIYPPSLWSQPQPIPIRFICNPFQSCIAKVIQLTYHQIGQPSLLRSRVVRNKYLSLIPIFSPLQDLVYNLLEPIDRCCSFFPVH